MRHIAFAEDRDFDIILVGRVCIDFNPLDYFKPLSASRDFRKYLGGSPANIAVGLARLGKKVGFIGRVSDDEFGRYVTEFFEKEGIDTSNIFKAEKEHKLGLTFTEILSPDESSILMYREGAADLTLDPSEICEDYIKRAKILLVSGTALSASPSREACYKAIQLAKKNGVKVIFDIDYREYTWKSRDEIAVSCSYAAEHSDIVMGSREEFDLTESISAPGRTDEETAAYWLSRGNSIVIIKHGKKGSTAHTATGEYNIKPFPVKAFKSFGGGDGYGSAFIYGLLEGLDIVDCLELGSASASMLVAAHGCSEFMPTIDELKKFIADEKKEFGEMVARG